MTVDRKYRFLISSIDAFGHINCALGFGELLASYGHQVTFTHRYQYKKLAEKRNFDFIPWDEAIFADKPPAPLVSWFERTASKFRLDSLSTYSNWTDQEKQSFSTLLDDYDFTNRALEKVFDDHRFDFDCFIGDFVQRYPAFYRSPFPCLNLLSMNPVPLYPKGPPAFSGLSVHSDKSACTQFKDAYADAASLFKQKIFSWYSSYSIPLPGDDEYWFDEPQHLGFYHYPEQLDYSNDVGPIRSNKWHRIDVAIRQPDSNDEFIVPQSLANLPGKLIFFSLGSLGSADVQLMNRLINYLADSPHRFIVSKGPNGDQIQLAPNMWGQNYVNQLAVLKVVDLVITHGGNNTFLETIYAVKPMIVIPVFMDQLDNAQRAVDCGIGSRLDFHSLTRETILKTIGDALNNREMATKIRDISASMRTTKSREKAVEVIENFLANRAEE